MKILTLLGVIVLFLALVFYFVPVGGGNVQPLMTVVGALLIGIGSMIGQ